MHVTKGDFDEDGSYPEDKVHDSGLYSAALLWVPKLHPRLFC